MRPGSRDLTNERNHQIAWYFDRRVLLPCYLVIAESNLGSSISSARLAKLLDDEIDELRCNTY